MIKEDIKRYQRKGLFWNVVSMLIGIALSLAIPALGQWLWPKIYGFIKLHEIPEWKFSLFFSWIYNALLFSGTNLVFMVIYKIEHPFFE